MNIMNFSTLSIFALLWVIGNTQSIEAAISKILNHRFSKISSTRRRRSHPGCSHRVHRVSAILPPRFRFFLFARSEEQKGSRCSFSCEVTGAARPLSLGLTMWQACSWSRDSELGQRQTRIRLVRAHAYLNERLGASSFTMLAAHTVAGVGDLWVSFGCMFG